jgi:hypothetical protein
LRRIWPRSPFDRRRARRAIIRVASFRGERPLPSTSEEQCRIQRTRLC